MKKSAGRRWIKRLFFIFGIAALAAAVFLQPFAHIEGMKQAQEGKRQDISHILQKERLGAKDYKKIFSQTGVARAGVARMQEKLKEPDKALAEFQDCFLGECEIDCCQTSAFTRQDQRKNEEQAPLIPLENGDILISFSSHSLGWRHGHAGLVVDAEQEKVLEAVTPGECSKIKSMGYWQSCSQFLVFRLKDAPYEKRNQIASFACENLEGIPYSLISGVFGGEEKGKPPLSAQCAYLIWYAFFCFGYDLDSDGGRVVTVMDLAKSPQLELLQVSGMDLREAEKITEND